jgi:hypothetical protein
MPINLNLALQALDNETVVDNPHGKKYCKKIKPGRYRYTKTGKLTKASASNKDGFNIGYIKPRKKSKKKTS